MAIRLTSTFYTINSEVFTVEVHDSAYGGSAVAVETAGEGFVLSVTGGEEEAGVCGTKVTVPFVVNDETTADIESFGLELLGAAEGQITVKITRKSSPVSSSELYWVGYVLPDLSGYEDSEVYTFNVTATDGIGRLKGIEYKDTGDVPYGNETAFTHLLNCLTVEDSLYTTFYTGSDIFLRTVVNWQDATIGTPVAAVCPTTRMRFPGSVFAKAQNIEDGDAWEFMSCYKVLDTLCKHFYARLIYSHGSYRFEQLNERANDTFYERRFSYTGSLISSSAAAGYDKTIDQTDTAAKLATNVYNYLPAYKQVEVTYDHKTYRNFLQGKKGWWKKGGSANGFYQYDGITTDANTIVRITGRVYYDVAVAPTAYTAPWYMLFNVIFQARTGNEYLRQQIVEGLDGSGNPTNTLHTGAISWETAGEVYISTDFQYGESAAGYIDFEIVSPPIPTGTTGWKIKFAPDANGIKLNDGSPITYTLTDWYFTQLRLNFVDSSDPYAMEAIRVYTMDNPTSGNSEAYQLDELFGNPINGWTDPKIQTSGDGSTWLDCGANWEQGNSGTAYEFGELLAAEIMSARQTPKKSINGEITGTAMYAHSRLVTPDLLGWILRNGEYMAQPSTWSGEWVNAGVDRITSVTIKKKIAEPPIVVGSDPIGNEGVSSNSIKGPTIGKGNIALTAVSTNYIATALAAGTITSIALEYAVQANAYLANDDIFVVNPATGEIDGFTVSATAAAGATSLSVVSKVIDNAYPIGCHIIYSALNKYTGQGGGGTNLPKGTAAGQILRWNNSTSIWEVYSGSTDGHVLTWDTANGWQAEAASGGIITAVNNGLSLSGTTIQLGGALIQNTLISGAFAMNFTTTKFIVGTTSTTPTASVNFHKANPSGTTLTSVIAHMSASGTDNNAKVSLGIGDVYNSGIGHFFNGGSGLTRLYNMTSTQQIRFAIGGETSDKVTIIGNNIGRLGAGFAGSTNLVSTLQSAGSFGANVTTHSGALTIGEDHFVMLYVGSTTVTWTMPSAAAAIKRMYVVGNMSANSTINLSVAISYKNGQQFSQIFQNEWVCFWSTGAAWYGFKLVSL